MNLVSFVIVTIYFEWRTITKVLSGIGPLRVFRRRVATPLTHDRSCLTWSTPCSEHDIHFSQVACELLEIVCRRHSKGIAQGEHRAPGMGKDTVNGAIASEALESWPLGGAQNDQACVHLH